MSVVIECRCCGREFPAETARDEEKWLRHLEVCCPVQYEIELDARRLKRLDVREGL